MRINEIKETREVVVRTEYIAKDGTIFKDKEECERYEKTCKCVIMTDYNTLIKGYIAEYGLFDSGSEEFGYDLIEIKDETSREIVNKALKFWYKDAKLVEPDAIGTIIMVARDYDDSLSGYHTTIDKILDGIKSEYTKALKKMEEQEN